MGIPPLLLGLEEWVGVADEDGDGDGDRVGDGDGGDGDCVGDGDEENGEGVTVVGEGDGNVEVLGGVDVGDGDCVDGAVVIGGRVGVQPKVALRMPYEVLLGSGLPDMSNAAMA